MTDRSDAQTHAGHAMLARAGGPTIAYNRSPGRGPGVVFLGGFMSDMTGTKALAVEAHARARGHAMLRFDYSGHGASAGKFEDGTIGLWREEAIDALDRLTEGPQILVGSSMGGWLMLLAALARPERVAGLIGIAPAPDFTEDLIWDTMAPAARALLMRTGVYYEPSVYRDTPYPITRKLIDEGRDHLVLRGKLEIPRPVRLLHGQADPDVPWETSIRLAERLRGDDVRIALIKDGDHRLSRPQDIALLCHTLDELLDRPAQS